MMLRFCACRMPSTRYERHACMRAQVHTLTTCMHLRTRLQGGCVSPAEGCLLPAVQQTVAESSDRDAGSGAACRMQSVEALLAEVTSQFPHNIDAGIEYALQGMRAIVLEAEQGDEATVHQVLALGCAQSYVHVSVHLSPPNASMFPRPKLLGANHEVTQASGAQQLQHQSRMRCPFLAVRASRTAQRLSACST